MRSRTATRPVPLLSFALLASAAILLSACSSAPKPTSEMALAKSSVDRVISTPNTAQAAPVELQSARDKLLRAERAMANKDYVEARRLAQQAEADARLAESKASAATSRQALDEVRRANQALTNELNLRAPR